MVQPLMLVSSFVLFFYGIPDMFTLMHCMNLHFTYSQLLFAIFNFFTFDHSVCYLRYIVARHRCMQHVVMCLNSNLTVEKIKGNLLHKMLSQCNVYTRLSQLILPL